jgi:hypothetical protein
VKKAKVKRARVQLDDSVAAAEKRRRWNAKADAARKAKGKKPSRNPKVDDRARRTSVWVVGQAGSPGLGRKR